MMSPEEREEIEAELAGLPSRRAACIGALAAVQRRRGHVDEQAVSDVANFLDMSPHEVDGVASFYNLIFRKPVGRHVILHCDSVSCWILGADRVCGALREQIGADYGETSPDGRFTLLPMACLGACERAPVFMIDRDLHSQVDGRDLAGILERYR